VSWDATNLGDWQRSIDGASAVVHLAGEQAVGRRFTRRLKQRIFASRVHTAELLVRAIAQASVTNRPLPATTSWQAFVSPGRTLFAPPNPTVCAS
jgi:NAD dependent epimerase/dehydratase family enzyme